MDTNIDEKVPDQATLREVLIADRWRILILLGIIFTAAVFLGFSPKIPRSARLGGVVLLVTGVAAYPYARMVVEYLYSPDYTYLLDVDARDNQIALYKIPPEIFREISTDGVEELHQVEAQYPTYECRNYDPEERHAEGTWRASATDLEMIAEQTKIDEIRTDLEELAQEGISLRVKQSGIIRKSLREIINGFIASFESESIYDGEKIDQAIEQSLQEVGFESDDEDDDPLDTHDKKTNESDSPVDPARPALFGQNIDQIQNGADAHD